MMGFICVIYAFSVALGHTLALYFLSGAVRYFMFMYVCIRAHFNLY